MAGRTWSAWHRCLVTCCPSTCPRTSSSDNFKGRCAPTIPAGCWSARSKTAAEEQPLLIVVEDAHWCDSASWALAWLVSQQIPTALLVLALRPLAEPIPEDTSAFARRPAPNSSTSIPCRLTMSPRWSRSGWG